MEKFTEIEWKKINATLQVELQTEREPFGLPEFRSKSVVLGSFNIRELGSVEKRSEQSWEFLKMICLNFDLIAIQEVQDELEGIRHLQELLNAESKGAYGLVVSDTTGKTPGSREGSAERLAFLFRWARVSRTELASDISYDRASVVNTLLEHREEFNNTFLAYQNDLEQWKQDKAAGKDTSKPELVLPTFLTFIRQPHCASFEVVPEPKSGKSYQFLLVNAHLLYGTDKRERRWEFDALINWLTQRARVRDASYENIIMMGDCNLEFKDGDVMRKEIEGGVTRDEIDTNLKKLNSTVLIDKDSAKANFPLLTKHPERGWIRTNARSNQTYDQIAIFAHDPRLPDHKANETAGTTPDQFDYGAFRFNDLFAKAFFNESNFEALDKDKQKWLIKRTEWDISDHMPVWFRLPIPE